jgi:rhodanese-related sulfurtransferase
MTTPARQPLKALSVTEGRLWVPMLNILLVSLTLGVVYNRATPLGVRSPGAARSSTTEAPVQKPEKGYFNETIAMSLEPLVASARTPGGGIPFANLPPGTLLTSQWPDTPVPAVSWPEVKPLVQAGKTVLVDARPAAHYQAEHIAGAVSLPPTISAAELAAFTAKHSKSSSMVVYCATEECPLARKLAGALIGQYGYSDVKVLAGGFAEYRVAEQKAAATVRAIK